MSLFGSFVYCVGLVYGLIMAVMLFLGKEEEAKFWWRAALATLLLACAVACGGSHPTAPGEPIVPPFVFQNATQSEQETAIALWDKESACIGLDPSKAHLVPFTVMTEPMYCGTILAAGCTTSNPPSVKVRREWFSQDQCLPGYEPSDCHAAQTELLHLALLLHGEDWGYQNPAFGRCL